MPRTGFCSGKFLDRNFLRTGPRGFCLARLTGANKNIAPVFKSRRRQSSLPAYGANKCPVQDLNPYPRFRRPVLYPIELTGRMSILAKKRTVRFLINFFGLAG